MEKPNLFFVDLLRVCNKGQVFILLLQPGYMLYERVLRPAEVGVTQAAENDTQDNNTN